MQIRFFKKNEIDILKKAISDLWAKNHILSRDENLLNFMFSTYPNSDLITQNDELNFLGAWLEGKVIGLLGVMPFNFNIKGKKGLACCLTNWIVNPEYRHLGAGLALINYVHQFKPDMILSLGVSQEGSKVYKLMRWDIVEDVPRWIGIVNKADTIDSLLNGNGNSVRHWNEVSTCKESNFSCVQEVSEIDNLLWNDFYWNNFAKKSVGIARDADFINWRYINHPSFNYKVLEYKENGEYKGLAIVRIESILTNKKIGRIVEFIASNQDSAVSLASAIIELDRDVLFYDFYCFSNITTWGLEVVGFKQIFKSKEDIFVLPTRFQPVDLSTTSMLSAVHLSDKIKSKWNPVANSLWYVTKGDADQDRPN